MKKLLLIIFAAATVAGCKKEEQKKEDGPTGFVPKGNFVFKLDGVQYDLNAKIRVPSPNLYQLYWDSTDMTALRSLLLTVNSNVPRTYPLVQEFDNVNQAVFSYVIISGPSRKDYISISGSFVLSNVTDGKWTATFSGRVKDKETGDEFDITDGRLIGVPQE
ncbi:MAG: hypothetical protein ACK4K9_02670 [Bacteroidia bacterium]